MLTLAEAAAVVDEIAVASVDSPMGWTISPPYVYAAWYCRQSGFSSLP